MWSLGKITPHSGLGVSPAKYASISVEGLAGSGLGSYDHQERFAALLTLLPAAKREYLIWAENIPPAPSQIKAFKDYIRNGIFHNWRASKYSVPGKSVGPWQLHVYPLEYWFWYTFYYFSRHTADDLAARKVLEVMVDGQEVDFHGYCLNSCPHALRRALNQCAPWSRTCQDAPDGFTRRFFEPAAPDWFAAHQPNFVPDPVHLPAESFRPLSKSLLRRPFQKVDVYDIETDQDLLDVYAKDKCKSAKLAAGTRSWRQTLCVGCIKNHPRNHYPCHYSRCLKTTNCSGPILDEDLQAWVRACQPWMLHALHLCNQGHMEFDFKGEVTTWRKCRVTLGKALAPGPGRTIWLQRSISSHFDAVHIDYNTFCRVGKIQPVNRWKDLLAGLPSGYEFIDHPPLRATAYCMAMGYLNYCTISHMHGQSDVPLKSYWWEVSYRDKPGLHVWLDYRSFSQKGRKIFANLTELALINGMTEAAAFTLVADNRQRKAENKLLHEFYRQHKATMPAQAVLALFRKDPIIRVIVDQDHQVDRLFELVTAEQRRQQSLARQQRRQARQAKAAEDQSKGNL